MAKSLLSQQPMKSGKEKAKWIDKNGITATLHD
jgi:hypothetical protein